MPALKLCSHVLVTEVRASGRDRGQLQALAVRTMTEVEPSTGPNTGGSDGLLQVHLKKKMELNNHLHHRSRGITAANWKNQKKNLIPMMINLLS